MFSHAVTQKMRALLDQFIDQEIPLYPTRKTSVHVRTMSELRTELGLTRMSKKTQALIVHCMRANLADVEYVETHDLFRFFVDLDKVVLTLVQTHALLDVVRANNLRRRAGEPKPAKAQVKVSELMNAEPPETTPQAAAEWFAERCVDDAMRRQFWDFVHSTCFAPHETDTVRAVICRYVVCVLHSGEVGILFAQWPAHLEPNLYDHVEAEPYARFLRIVNGQVTDIIRPSVLAQPAPSVH